MKVLRIDGYIGADDGMSILFGGSPNYSLKALNAFLDALPSEEKELKIEINSGGGSVTEGFAIHDKLASSGLTIHTEVLGLCGSIATIIALSAPVENRSMHENSEYFIHNPFWQPMAPDAMEAKDLQRIADDLKNSEEKILDFYAKNTNESRSKLRSMMSDAKGFSAKEAKQLGFVSKVITVEVNEKKYLIAAYVNPTKEKSTDMDFTPTQKTGLQKMFADFGNKIESLFKVPFKNMLVELESGGSVWVDSEDDLFVGKKVYLTDAEGNRTNDPAPDGEHKTKDGKTLVVASGVVTEVKEAVPTEDAAALKAKVDELTAQLAAANGSKAEVEKTVEALKVENKTNTDNFMALKTEFTTLQNKVLGNDIPAGAQSFKGGEMKKTSDQEWLEYKNSQKKK